MAIRLGWPSQTHTCISRVFSNNGGKNNLALIGSSRQAWSCIKPSDELKALASGRMRSLLLGYHGVILFKPTKAIFSLWIPPVVLISYLLYKLWVKPKALRSSHTNRQVCISSVNLTHFYNIAPVSLSGGLPPPPHPRSSGLAWLSV